MPAAAKTAHDPDLIARLQAEAARSPRMYRFRLAAIAIAGDLALTTTKVLPWAAPIVFGALLFNLKLFYWLGGAAIVFLAWLFRPTFRFEGRQLSTEEAPRLYEEMQRLKRSLNVPSRMHVYLDESFNASAAETRGLFGLFGTKCALTLGIPLLAAFSREQVLAVIAHEFGHFSRRHGRLGHWIYRARVGWMQIAHDAEDTDSSFDRAAAWYARRFVPFFSARSFVHSRQCEYEADADAALVVGGRAFAEALTQLSVIGRFWEEAFPRQLTHLQRERSEPPPDIYQCFERAAKECTPDVLRSWLDEALEEPSSWSDTHPSLAERLRSLNEKPLLATTADSAGEALFGEQWAKLSAEFNNKWVKEVRTDWSIEHLRIRYIALPLLEADEETVLNWDIDVKLARARELRRSDPARGLRELRGLYQANPSHARCKFAYAAALLNENVEAGVELMRSCARENGAYRGPAYLRLLTYFDRKGDSREAERWSTLVSQVSQKLSEAVSLFLERAESGEFQLSSLPQKERTVILEAVRLHPCIVKAWLLEGDAEFHYAPDRPATRVLIHLLVLIIDPEALKNPGQDAERIAEHYETMLQNLVFPDQLGVVRSYFTTEAIPAAYRARSNLSLNADAREETVRAS